MIAHTGCAIYYVLLLPNYSKLLNFSKAAQHSSTAVLSLLIIITYFASNSLFTAYGLFTIVPLHLLLVYNIIEKRVTGLLNKSIESASSYYEFELIIREQLMDLEPCKELLGKFYQMQKLKTNMYNDIFCVWESNYCLDVLKDERLAVVKLQKAKNSCKTLGGSFQIYMLRKRIGNVNIRHKELAEVQRLADLSSIKEYEVDLYKAILRWLLTVCESDTTSNVLVGLTNTIASLTQELNEKYTNFIKLNPDNLLDLSSYGNFIQKILGQDQRAELVFQQQEHRKSHKTIEPKNIKTGIMLVSAEAETIGKIMYLNQEAAEVLDSEISLILGCNIIDYIPKPYDKLHIEYMREHIFNCTKTIIDFPDNFVITNEANYLIEVKLNLCICNMNELNFYLLRISKLGLKRQIANIHPDGTVYTHSELFSYYLGLPHKNLEGTSLMALLPSLFYEGLIQKNYLIFQLPRLKVALIYVHVPFRKTFMDFVIVTEDLTFVEKKLSYKKVDKDIFSVRGSNIKEEEEFCQLSNEERNGNNEAESAKATFLTANSHTPYGKNESIIKDKILSMNRDKDIDIQKITNFREEYQVTQLKSEIVANLDTKEKMKVNLTLQRAAKDFKWLRLINKLTFLIVLALSIILVTLISTITGQENKEGAADVIGELIYALSHTASLTRLLQISLYNSTFVSKTVLLSDFAATQPILIEKAEIIYKNKEAYSACSGLRSLYEPKLKVYGLDKNITYKNLIDFLDRYIEISQAFIKEINNSQIVSENAMYLIENSYGSLVPYLNYTMAYSIQCSESTSSKVILIYSIIYLIQNVVLSISLLLICLYVKNINQLYNRICNITRKLYNVRWSRAINMCNSYLKAFKLHETIPDGCIMKIKNKKVKYYLSFVPWTFFYFSLLVISAALVFSYSQSISNILKLSPSIKYNLYLRKELYQEMTYYASEAYVYNNNISVLINNYTYVEKFYSGIVYNKYNSQKIFLMFMNKPEIQKLLSSDNKRMQYEFVNDTDMVFWQGTKAAGSIIVFDVLNSASDLTESHLDILITTYNRVSKLSTYLNLLIQEFASHSLTLINEIIGIAIIIIMILGIFSIACGFLAFDWFFQIKLQEMQNLHMMCLIIINN